MLVYLSSRSNPANLRFKVFFSYTGRRCRAEVPEDAWSAAAQERRRAALAAAGLQAPQAAESLLGAGN